MLARSGWTPPSGPAKREVVYPPADARAERLVVSGEYGCSLMASLADDGSAAGLFNDEARWWIPSGPDRNAASARLNGGDIRLRVPYDTWPLIGLTSFVVT